MRTLVCLFFSILVLSSAATAQSIRYVDESGNIFFVDREEQVPDKYRNQLVVKKPVRMTKKDFARYQKEVAKQQREKERKKLKAEKEREKELKKRKREAEKENEDRHSGRQGVVKKAPTPAPTPAPVDAGSGNKL